MKSTFKIVFAIGMIMALFSSTTTVAQEWTKDQKEVWNVVVDSWNKWAAGDIEGSMASIHEKYQGWSSDSPLPIGKEKLTDWYTAMKNFAKVNFHDVEPARITIVGNAAVVHYYFSVNMTYTIGEEKSQKDISGKNAEFYIKDGGKWLLLGDMTAFDDKKDK